MKYEVKLPNYNRSILSISSSILKRYQIHSNYPSLKELDYYLEKSKSNTIFIIIDCMGLNILENNLAKDSFLRKHLVTTVTSVFPPTTAAATTAFHSGQSPLESGWIGWMPFFKKYNRMIELFTGTDYYTKEKIIDSKDILPYKTIYQKIEDNKKIKYNKIFPISIDSLGYKNYNDIINKTIKITKENKENIISIYCDELDKAIHLTGITSKDTKKKLLEIEKMVYKLSKNIKNYTIIISADHGAINIKEKYLEDYKLLFSCLKRPPSIEARFISFFIKNGKKKIFKKELNKLFSNKYLLYTKNKFLKENFLGFGTPKENINEVLGDYIFISKSEIALKYKRNNKVAIADHSGITKEEMIVPVIIIDG